MFLLTNTLSKDLGTSTLVFQIFKNQTATAIFCSYLKIKAMYKLPLIIIHYIIFYYKKIWMFYKKFADKGDNSVNNLSIYNVEGDNRLSPVCLQPLTTGSLLKIPFFLSVSVIVFSIPNFIMLSFYKTKHSSLKHLKVVSV